MKKFILLIAIIIFSASSAFADVSPELVKQDQRFGPYIEFTKSNGAKFMTGRYAHTKEITSRTGGNAILAPTDIIIEINSFSMANASYSGNMNVYNRTAKYPVQVTFDASGEVPIMKIIDSDGSVIAEDYAIVMYDGENYVWEIGSVKTGEVRYLYPLNEYFFPEGWYLGEWECSDGSNIEFRDGKIFAQGQEFGSINVIDDRIEITTQNGEKDVIFAIQNPATKDLVMTFSSGPNGMGENAGVFTKTSKTQTQQKSQGINGTWTARVNDQQLILKFDGNNYQGWINGHPSETGVFQLNGNTFTGRTTTGVNVLANIELDPTGNYLTMTFANGVEIIYQRLQ